jgi:PAS domain S-box-containing protein
VSEPRPRLRVLIVEDSRDDFDLMVRELERGGFEVETVRVEDEPSMRAALEGRAWDAVLADYTMPRFNAHAALEVVRERGLDVPFLIVSASIGEETAVAAMHAGANDYIFKDNLSRLVPAVNRELREAEGRRARRDAEEALRESEARYRSLVEHTSDIITMSDAEGRWQYVSPSVERILGYTPQEFLALDPFSAVHPEDLAEVTEAFRRLVHEGVPFSANEFRFRHKSGAWRILEVISTMRTTHEGRTTVLGAVRDVTDRRMLEEQFRQSQKMEAVGRLAGGVAHDFNNLLTVIQGYCDLLREEVRDEPRLREDVEEIAEAAERAAGLTRQLLAFSRRQLLAPRVVDLNDVVARMEGLLRRLIGEDIELATRLDAGLGPVRADPNQLEQVVMNLAVNSRDAMPSGGKITLETANIEVRTPIVHGPETVPAGSYATLAVTDTGTGMDPETLEHLFEPFFTTKEPGKGTGLGLATVYGVVRQSGGHVLVRSDPGRGTTVRVYLPRVEAAAKVEGGERPQGPLPRGTGTILLVEDEDQVRVLAREILTRHGYRVLEARGATEALAIATRPQGEIDLMLTDVIMPGLSGRELAERLAALQPAMRVMYMSGYADRGIVHEGELHAGTAYLQKPFTPDALVRMVRDVLGGAVPAPPPRSVGNTREAAPVDRPGSARPQPAEPRRPR